MTSPNLDRRTVLAGLSALPPAAVFPPPALASQTAKDAWLEDCASALVKHGAMPRDIAEDGARACLVNTLDAEGAGPDGLPPHTTGRAAAFVEMQHWDAS